MTAYYPIIGKVVLLVFCFLALTPRVSAATLTIANPFQHDGLTFLTPLNISDPRQLKTKRQTLKFGSMISYTNVSITKNKTILAETISPLPTKKAATAVLPTIEKLPTPTPTITTKTSTKSVPTPIPSSPTPIILNNQLSSGLNADKLFNMSNSYRASKGLASFQKDEKTCQLASSRAPEIGAEIAGGYMHSGLRTRNLPYRNNENIISMRNEEEAFNWWINDAIHREAIEGNYTYSCVACSGNSCVQEFTNYQAK